MWSQRTSLHWGSRHGEEKTPCTPSPKIPQSPKAAPEPHISQLPAAASFTPFPLFSHENDVPSIPQSLEASPAMKGWAEPAWMRLSCGSKGSVCSSPPSLMFWTNWNEQHPSIMRATLSGANVLIIIDQDIRTPNGLAIDHKAEKIYFSDATLDKIERCEYDGSHRHVSLSPVGWRGECPNWGWSVVRGDQSCSRGWERSGIPPGWALCVRGAAAHPAPSLP